VTEGADAADISLALRPVRREDIPRLVELNNQASPAVPVETDDSVAALLELSGWTAVVEGSDNQLIGAVITVNNGVDYSSENYRYF
jgi:hypothetical protein